MTLMDLNHIIQHLTIPNLMKALNTIVISLSQFNVISHTTHVFNIYYQTIIFHIYSLINFSFYNINFIASH